MQEIQEAKKLILEAKNIYVIPSRTEEGESIPNALALFYTLKELNKNVNLIIDDFPEKFKFLTPCLDFVSYPKNFVISIPGTTAEVSQVYYEKNDENVKIHITAEKGSLKKENLSFYYSEPKPDLIITLQVNDFKEKLVKELDSFGFLLDCPIINIANTKENKNFGDVNIIKETSISCILTEIMGSINQNFIGKEISTCLLAGLMDYTNNFANQKTDSEALELAGFLMKKGATRQEASDNLYKQDNLADAKFLAQVFKNMVFGQNNMAYSVLNSLDFYNFSEKEAANAVKKIKVNFPGLNNLLVLWKSHTSTPKVKGFFYSEDKSLLQKVKDAYQAESKENWLFLSIENENPNFVKEEFLARIN